MALRDVWVAFTVSMLLFGFVVVLAVDRASTELARWWVAALVVASVLCLIAVDVFGRRPLDCSDLASLAVSYRNRFFWRTALSESVALLAFTVTFIVGQWWVY